MRDFEFAMKSICENTYDVLKQFDEAIDYLLWMTTPHTSIAVTPPTPADPVDLEEEDETIKDFGLLPVRILHSGPKTIVFWDDGTKTIVSLSEGAAYDKSTAFCWALAKKIIGSTSAIRKIAEYLTVEQKAKTNKRDAAEKQTSVLDHTVSETRKQTEVQSSGREVV